MGITWDETATHEPGDDSEYGSVTPDWDQEAICALLSEFDALIPADDKIADFDEGDTSDFDAEADADGDLNATVASKHDGSHGIEITFDDANAAWGLLQLGAVDQDTFYTKFWINTNDMALEAAKIMYIAIARDGTPAWICALYIAEVSGTYLLALDTLEDGAAHSYTAGTVDIKGNGWHQIILMGKISSGADDGFYKLYHNGVLDINLTGQDNDTYDFDDVAYGMAWTSSTTFGGSFYMDTIHLDPDGAPSIAGWAAKRGTGGLIFPINSTALRYARLDDPSDEDLIIQECWINTDLLTMANGDSFRIMQNITGGGLEYFARLHWSTVNNFRVILYGYHDDTSNENTGFSPTLAAGWNSVRLVWKKSTAPGANNGAIWLFVNGDYVGSVTDLDNDLAQVDALTFGPSAGLDAGTCGILLMEDCRWSNGPGSPIWVVPEAAHAGVYGAAVALTAENVAVQANLLGPVAEAVMMSNCRVKPNALSITGTAHIFMDMLSGVGPRGIYAVLGYSGGSYYIAAAYQVDGGGFVGLGSSIPITDAWHEVTLGFRKSTAPGADNGELAVWVDGICYAYANGIDNDQLEIEYVRWGANSIHVDTYGVFYLDTCRHADEWYLAPAVQMTEYRRRRLPGPISELS